MAENAPEFITEDGRYDCSRRKPAGLPDLPNELLYYILSYIPDGDHRTMIETCAFVCHSWFDRLDRARFEFVPNLRSIKFSLASCTCCGAGARLRPSASSVPGVSREPNASDPVELHGGDVEMLEKFVKDSMPVWSVTEALVLENYRSVCHNMNCAKEDYLVMMNILKRMRVLTSLTVRSWFFHDIPRPERSTARKKLEKLEFGEGIDWGSKRDFISVLASYNLKELSMTVPLTYQPHPEDENLKTGFRLKLVNSFQKLKEPESIKLHTLTVRVFRSQFLRNSLRLGDILSELESLKLLRIIETLDTKLQDPYTAATGRKHVAVYITSCGLFNLNLRLVPNLISSRPQRFTRGALRSKDKVIVLSLKVDRDTFAETPDIDLVFECTVNTTLNRLTHQLENAMPRVREILDVTSQNFLLWSRASVRPLRLHVTIVWMTELPEKVEEPLSIKKEN